MTIIQELKKQRRTLEIMKNEIKAVEHTIKGYEKILIKLENENKK